MLCDETTIQSDNRGESNCTPKNPFINGIEEKIIEGFNTEALAKNLKGAFMTELEIRKADVDNLQIAAQKKVGDRNIQKKKFLWCCISVYIVPAVYLLCT